MAVSGPSDARANNLLDVEWRGVTPSSPATFYFALSITLPSDRNGTGITEPTAADYARIGVTKNTTNFTAASGRQLSNTAEILFSAATLDDWGALIYVPIYTTLTGATCVGG